LVIYFNSHFTPLVIYFNLHFTSASVVDREFEPGRIKPKAIKLVFVASPLSTEH
jgi:hypothetical protein